MDITFNPTVSLHIRSDLIALAVATALERSRIKVASDPDARVDLHICDDSTPDQPDDDLTPRILLTEHPQPRYILNRLRAGFAGCLVVGDSLVERLPQAVRDVARGKVYLSPTAAAALLNLEHYTSSIAPRLTPYQREVLRLTVEGWPGARIAAALGRKRPAIYQVQSYLREQFGVGTNAELRRRAVELGIVPTE